MKRHLLVLILLSLTASGFAQNTKAKKADGTECAAFPCMVATVSLTDQSQSVPSTVIFAPTSDGIFRITPYITTSSGTDKGAQWALLFGWTDQNETKKSSISADHNNSVGLTVVVRDLATQNISYLSKRVHSRRRNAARPANRRTEPSANKRLNVDAFQFTMRVNR